MHRIRRLAQASFLFGLTLMSVACLVEEPREGYYDRDHARWYHEHHWYTCHDGDEHCR